MVIPFSAMLVVKLALACMAIGDIALTMANVLLGVLTAPVDGVERHYEGSGKSCVPCPNFSVLTRQYIVATVALSSLLFLVLMHLLSAKRSRNSTILLRGAAETHPTNHEVFAAFRGDCVHGGCLA